MPCLAGQPLQNGRQAVDSVWTACVVVNPKLLLLGIGRTSVQDCLKQSIGQKSVHPTV